MKLYSVLISAFCSVSLLACSPTTAHDHKSRVNLKPQEFFQTMNELQNELVLDVRTPEEFEKNHLPGAINININDGAGFREAIKKYATDQPMMVYCLSGGRSKEASDALAALGYSNIYEMKGGIMQWVAEGFDVSTNSSLQKASKGMSKQDFDNEIKKNKLVLVDFYADWCKPCKEMAPLLQEFAQEYKGKVELLKIDSDKNEELSQILAVDALPTLMLFQDGKMIWKKIGFTKKDEIIKALP